MKPKAAATNRKLTLAVLFSVITLVIGNLVVTNILATSGERLRNLEQRKEKLVEQNALLRMETIRLSSLETLETRAASLGLSRNIQAINVPSQPPIAMYQ